MNSYQIVGLNVSTVKGNSYETKKENGVSILHDSEGKGITKIINFPIYILYAIYKNQYYAIHLSHQHLASMGGKLCTIGIMNITPTDPTSSFTHSPIKPLIIPATLEAKEYDDEEDEMRMCLHGDSNTCVFAFSYIGKSERKPCGYVYVNMELFRENL
jgi:hypothetical protein